MKKWIAALFLIVLTTSLLCACTSGAVKKTEEAIDAIGAVNLNSEDAIRTAKELYDALDEEKKAQVLNHDTLEKAEETLQTLKIENVERLINQIDAGDTLRKETIDAARAAFDALDEQLQKQVKNSDRLLQAEEKYEVLTHISDYLIPNYKRIGTTRVSLFRETAAGWFGKDNTAAATAFMCFLLEGDSEGSIDIGSIHYDAFICICRAEDRVDIYSKYGDDSILGIQYWPAKDKAVVGTIKTELSTKDYADILVMGGIVDAAKNIPLDSCMKVLNAMRG